MTNILIYTIFSIATLGFYLWHFKNSDIEIGLIKGFVFGGSVSSYKGDEVSTNYLDIYFGLVVISFIWDE